MSEGGSEGGREGGREIKGGMREIKKGHMHTHSHICTHAYICPSPPSHTHTPCKNVLNHNFPLFSRQSICWAESKRDIQLQKERSRSDGIGTKKNCRNKNNIEPWQGLKPGVF